MYNGIGLQTARGSGTNGYVQTNKFFVRPRTGGKPVNGGKGFEDNEGTAGLSKKPNKAILEHDRKRQIHLKLAILEDKLADQGYSDAEIAQKLEEARVNLEAAAAAANEESDGTGDSKISDTQTHQVAARKEKQMEAFRAALGLRDEQQVAEEGIIDDEPTAEAYEGRLKERGEHSFLDRDSGRKKLDENVDEKDGKVKESKKQRGVDEMDEVKRPKRKDSKKRRHGDSSEESDEHGRDRRRRSKKKAKGRKQESVSESDSSSSDSDSDSESESDSDDGKKRRRKKATKKRSRSKRSVSSDSEEVESDDSKKLRKSHKKSRPSNQSGSKEVRDRHDEQSRARRKRYDSDVSEPESEDNKQPLLKEEAYRGGRKHQRDEVDVEPNHLKDMYRGESGVKKVARDSDDSETEYGNKKQLRSKVEVYSAGMSQKRDEEEAVSKDDKEKYRSDTRGKKVARDSDDSEAEYDNGRNLKDESYQRGRKHIREEDEDYKNHGRDRYRSDDAVKRHGTIKEDDRYRGRAIEEEDSDKGEDDRGRYRQRRDTAEEDEEDYKRGRDRYRADEDRFRGDARRATGKEDEDDDRGVSREREYSNKGRSRYDDGRSSGKRSSYGDRA